MLNQKVLKKMTIDDIKPQGKRVLVRCDFNVPLIDGKISDDSRIVGALPTIKKLIDNKAKVILCSHLGKPEKKLSLLVVANRLSELLKKDVKFIKTDKVVDDDVRNAVRVMQEGEVLLLENTRLRPEEMENNDNFSMELASLCDIFVDDAFGTAHRAHASNVGITKFVSTCVSGYLMQKEIDHLINAVEKPKRPFVAILGGAKVSDKLKVIDKLLDKCDTIIIGGGMAYTFLKAQGKNVGKSLIDETKIDYCLDMIKKAKKLKKNLLLPIDAVCSKEFPNPINNQNVETKTFSFDEITNDYMGLDIGEKTIQLYMKSLKGAKTVIWNGPMGVFENQKYAVGTYCIARYLTELKNCITIVGGGDSASAVKSFHLGDKMTHVSTGGGVTLEFLEGVELPGITALTNKK